MKRRVIPTVSLSPVPPDSEPVPGSLGSLRRAVHSTLREIDSDSDSDPDAER